MELLQLRYFVAVAKAGSFVKAAEHEGVSQPALSQQIAKLESELGVPLFDRLGRSLRLTSFGRQVLPKSEDLLQQASIIRKDAEAFGNAACGRVTLGVIPTLLPYVVSPLLDKLRIQHPEIDLQLVEDQTHILIDKLRSADIDLAVLALPIRHPEIVCSELKREELVFISPLTGDNAQSGPVDLQALTKERLLLLREGNCLRDDVLTACSRAKAQFAQVFETDQLASIFALVAAGSGSSLVPSSAVDFHGSKVQVLPLRQRVYRRIGYAQLRSHKATAAQKTVIKWLRSALA
ncbi:LysR family transcriptional regulator [Bryobacterales bacterium F-183]|nr:LysR family transcriptional regulator [Bryobacterales bacterium F-183]